MKERFKLAGIEMKYFIPITIVLLVGMYLGKFPKGMLGAFPLMMVLGAILNYIGNKTPIIKDYLGGGPIVIIFVSAALVYFNVMPEGQIKLMKEFMTTQSFLDFYIAALVVGSILGMNRKLLIKAALGYLPVIIGGVAVAVLLTGIVGAVLNYGFVNSIFYIAIPIMGGGMGAGAVPLSQIFGQALNKQPTELLAVMVPAVALGNALAIVCAGLLDKLGQKYPKLTGNGKLLKVQDDSMIAHKNDASLTYEELGIGVIISTTFFIFGGIVTKFISIHAYAIMIIAVAIVKVFGLMDEYYESCCAKWFNFIMKNFTSALLVGIGVAYTSLESVIESFSPTYLILVGTTVVGAVIGTALVGKLVGFYMIEGSITAGLCMANMGGTGDVAVLSAAHRMELMPFAQISSRIGGAFMLLLTSLLINLLL
ncbi:2-hydroxycarboxylate transporter family protein [Fusobacterium sp.]|uniref:2-hydroxycarboxylate transporter family protein n=1 Tax=Fusobacterium sp. TaxID=68766 RepID=UPI00396C86C7